MPKTSPSALSRLLSSTPPGGVFFLHGEEEYLREEMVKRVVDAHLEQAVRDFNLDQLRGADAPADALASILATPPMMSPWRAVVVREAQALSPAAREVLLSALADPPGGLVLVVSATIPPKSKARFYQQLEKRAASSEFSRMSVADAPGWLVEQARERHGKLMAPETARLLVAGAGSDLGTLSLELDKLAGYVGEGKEIGADDVRAAGVSLPAQDRWEWFDLVGSRRFREARRALPALLGSGENGVGVVAGLGTHLLRVGLALAGGRGALERALPAYQRWLAGRLLPQTREWSPEELERALAGLLRADRLLKSAPLSDLQVLDELLLRLQADTSPGRRRAA
ncbi:MAG: DNA polymerase III subunit delta [Longimicrobiaceae bacterium]